MTRATIAPKIAAADEDPEQSNLSVQKRAIPQHSRAVRRDCSQMTEPSQIRKIVLMMNRGVLTKAGISLFPPSCGCPKLGDGGRVVSTQRPAFTEARRSNDHSSWTGFRFPSAPRGPQADPRAASRFLMSAASAAIRMLMLRRMHSPMRSSARWVRATSGGIFPIAIRATRVPTASSCLPRYGSSRASAALSSATPMSRSSRKSPSSRHIWTRCALNLARALGADAKLLNVKASSPEGLGALGRGDGMAAAAIVVLES